MKPPGDLGSDLERPNLAGWLVAGNRGWAVATALVARVAFWIITQRVWEDALITISHARNAVEGLGLTHHPGEPVTHGFTSALSVLVPLVGEAILPGAGLLVLRLTSLAAAAAAIVVADLLLEELNVAPWPRRFALLFLALDPLQVFYGMAGMETQIAVALLLWSAWLTTQDRPVALGLSLGFCLLARPDFAIWAGIVIVFRAIQRRQVVLTSLVALLVVAPWLAFTTLYYGSPIPQTILAKAQAFVPAVRASLPDWILGQLSGHLSFLIRTFAPFYENTLVFQAPLPPIAAVMISGAMWVLVIDGAIVARRRAPVVSAFVMAFTVYRIFALTPGYFDWYTPPVAALSVVLAASAMSRLHRRAVQRTVAAAAALAFAVPLIFTTGLERLVQRDIEDGVRRPAAQYLATVVRPGEPVSAEAAGYFEYYSRVTLYDFPGLTSRAALATVRSLPPGQRTVAAMIVAAPTPWIIVRPWEYADILRRDPGLAASYALCRVFQAPGLNRQISWSGMTIETVDDHFDVRHLGECGPEGAR